MLVGVGVGIGSGVGDGSGVGLGLGCGWAVGCGTAGTAGIAGMADELTEGMGTGKVWACTLGITASGPSKVARPTATTKRFIALSLCHAIFKVNLASA